MAKQLFEPLMMQLIHWFTGNHKFESDDTVALLDTLMVRYWPYWTLMVRYWLYWTLSW